MNESKQISEGAILIAIYVVLLLISLLIPFAIFILPVPFILYAARHSYRPAIIMFIATLLFTLIFATAISLPFTVVSGLGGIIIGDAIYKKYKPYETLVRGTLGFVIGLVTALLFLQFVLQVNIYGIMDELISEAIKNTESIIMKYVPSSGEDMATQLGLVKEQMVKMLDLIPVAIVAFGLMIAFISQLVSYKLMNRIFKETLYFPPFRYLNFPKVVIWFYLPVLILMLTGIDETNSLYLFVTNANTLFMLLMVIQGFSFIFFYAYIKKWNIAIPILIVVFVFITFGIFMFFIIIIGIIDIGLSLKRQIALSNKRK